MSLKILLVDDDEYIRTLNSVIFELNDIKNPLLPFNDGEAALHFLNKDSVDESNHYLVFLDINMPGIDGWGFLEELQNRRFKDRCYVIMVSLSMEDEDKLKSITYPQVIDYKEKPLSIRDVQQLYSKQIISHYLE